MENPASIGFDPYAARAPRAGWWATLLIGAALLLAVPLVGDEAIQLDLSVALILGMLALSMGFLWGYVGILSFGQTIFFGLGGYVYALFSLNTESAGMGVAAAIAVPMAFALIMGYFMIFARISEIYLSIITLVVTLIFEKTIRSTSGPEFVIGSVRLNGQNGIPGVPGIPLSFGSLDLQSIEGVFYMAALCLLVVYIGLRLLLLSPFGRILVGMRENERRMELLGFDSRLYKLMAFVLASGIAALAGVLYAIWGGFVGPEMFGLNQAALVVIWVIVGGRSTLIGPIAGAILIQYLSTWLGTAGVGQVTLVLGAILIVCVLVFPSGLVPTLAGIFSWCHARLFGRRRRP